MSGLCKYRHIFGKEGEGVHSLRLFDIAVFDLLGTILIAYGISFYIQKTFYMKESLLKIFGITFLILMVLALFLHRLFCVRTTLTKIFFD